MGKNGIKRIVSVLVAALLTAAQIAPVTGCNSKPEEGVKIVSKDSTWFNAKASGICKKYFDMKLDIFTSEFLGAYKDGVLVRAQGTIDIFNKDSNPDNDFDYIDYYSLSGELITSIDARELLLNREIDEVNVSDTEVVLRMHDMIRYAGSTADKCYLLNIDPEKGSAGDLKEIESIPVGIDAYRDNDLFWDGSWVIGDYRLTSYSKNTRTIFEITKNGESRIVELTGDPHYSGVSINDCIPVSEKEVVLINFSSSVNFISLNLETGEIQNKDEEYKWLKRLKIKADLYTFDGKTYVKDAYGIKFINFATKQMEEVLSYNDCNFNRLELAGADLLSIKGDRYVFARKTTDYDPYNPEDIKTKENPQVIVLEKSDKNPNAGKIILTAGVVSRFDLDNSIGEAVKLFNETNKKYYVQLENKLNILEYVDYRNADNSDETSGIFYSGSSDISNQLATDILSGDGPDIILYAGNYRQIHSEDYLVDLNSYIKGKNGIKESDYFSNVIDAAKTGDKLFYMPIDFSVSGILTDRSNVRSSQVGFTFDEYAKFVDEACNGANPLSGSRLEVLTKLYSYTGDTCINGKTVNFDNESFRALCNYVKDNINDKSFNMCTDAEDMIFSGLEGLLRDNGYKAKDQTLLGYPSADGRGPLISINISVGISAVAPSSVADGAWEFIKICLGSEIQDNVEPYNGNPMSIKSFESVSKETLEAFNKANPSTKVDDSVIESYKNILKSGSVIDNSDPAILVVIREEIPPYFVDQKNLDDILPIIKNRASTILSERYT
ncbi:MAG: extracellular solute-binding protein [Clostridiales bacterium]|nr:extracellular solute-binding protein [Clostridiales bacterium]